MGIFDVVHTDELQVVKEDGTHWPKFKGNVGKGKVSFEYTGKRLDAGDTILWFQSDGATQEFIVVDPGFSDGLRPIPPSYAATVRKKGHVPKARSRPVHSIHVHNAGTGNRVNIGSVDNSVNTYSAETNIFNQLREAAAGLTDAEVRVDADRHITTMEAAHGTEGFVPAYTRFMGFASDHLAVFQPFIPALAALLAGRGS